MQGKKGRQINHQIACLLWENDILWFHSSIVDRSTMEEWYLMISFPHDKRESLFVCFKGRSGYRACLGLPLCPTNRIRICPKKSWPPSETQGCMKSIDRKAFFIIATLLMPLLGNAILRRTCPHAQAARPYSLALLTLFQNYLRLNSWI